jgi:hypothetical protein
MDGSYRERGTFVPGYLIEKKKPTQDISSADSAGVI